MAHATENDQKSNIRKFPARTTEKNLQVTDVKTADPAIRDLDATLEKILLEQSLQRKAAWSARGVL